MESKRGITMAVLDKSTLLIGVPGTTTPEAARMFQMYIQENLPDWRPLVVGNGVVIDLRSVTTPEAGTEAAALVERLQEILESLPDVAEPGELRPIE